MWGVEYRALRFAKPYAPPVPELEEVRSNLRTALRSAEAFARRPEMEAGSWAEWFSRARALLDDPAPEPPFHRDMLPATDTRLAARQILAASVQAYVFGGMGSWNDLGFADADLQTEYDGVTRKLYETLKTAILAASNAFGRMD